MRKQTNHLFHILSFMLVLGTIFAFGLRNDVAYADGADRMYTFNMGFDGMQGNLILVESDGQWGLLDTGHRNADTIQDANGRVISLPQSEQYSNQISMRNGKDVAQYMINKLGVTHLDFIVGTHSHMDHIGGVPEIAKTSFRDANGQTRYLVDSNTTYFYKEYKHIADFEDDLVRYSETSFHNQAYYYQAVKTMREQGANMVDVSKQQVVQGDPGNAYGDYVTFTMGNMTFRLYNVHEQTNTGSENTNSIVTVMTNGDYTVVNLSDINTGNAAIDKTSQAIGKDFGAVDVVVAGHHGLAGSNTKTMFDELQPNFVVVSNDAGEGSWLYTDCDLAAAMPYAKSLFGTSFYSTALSPYAIVTDLSGNRVYIYNLESNGKLTDAFYKAIKSSNKTGWVSWLNTKETLWCYLENGKAATGWKEVDGVWYYFDPDGIMHTGWLDNGGGQLFFFDANGAAYRGWKHLDGKWKYFDSEGHLVHNSWQEVDGNCYYFDADGSMHTGWLDNGGGQLFFFDNDGVAYRGWKEIDGKWKYFDPEGRMAHSCWQEIDGNWYYFNEDGSMHTGWLDNGGGQMFFFDNDGVACKGWKEIDGKRCYFDSEGHFVRDSWQEIDGNWVYFDADGVMQTNDPSNEKSAEETKTSAPEAVTGPGWQEIDGNWYYFNEDGSRRTGWQEIDGNWYYFYDDGSMAKDTVIEGYYVNADGVWVP